MKLLIVEDEQKIANSLRRGFQDENFNVELAFDGEKGLLMGRTEEFDAIILDLMLPKLDGLTLLSKLREAKNYTPVILLTAKDSIQDKVKGLNSGADDYLPKPFSFDELLARVRSLIRRATNNENILKVDNLELNPYTHIVKRKGMPINLSAKEFSLLEYLMRHKDAITSESQIINHVWDYDYDGLSNVVAVHIKNLRLKIDKPFPKDKQLIKTVRNLGYRLEE